ncbi:MAG: hypothetical protein HY356_04400 [Gammaproteobacteria bacterium]|nr:hypothetical protein [Gammaproteobacteria bacterium]
MRGLTLFIPGLLQPARDLTVQDLPSTPSLERLLACGRKEQQTPFSFSDALCKLFSLNANPANDLPVAAITRLVDDEHSVKGIWMRADPVHLTADREGVVLMDGSTFTLDQHDALVLATDIRGILAERDLELEVPTVNRWYLRLNELPAVRTTAIHEVAGKDIHHCMPAGADRAYWSQLMNEIQMCLHASGVNEQRQQRKELSINSIWFWGSGELPGRVECEWSWVFSDEEIARGLAIHAGIPWSELPESIDGVIDQFGETDNVLVVITFGLRHAQYHDLKGWQDFIAYLEQYWFFSLLNYLKAGELEELSVITEFQKIKITKLSLYKLWKKRKTIRTYID